MSAVEGTPDPGRAEARPDYPINELQSGRWTGRGAPQRRLAELPTLFDGEATKLAKFVAGRNLCHRRSSVTIQ